MVAGPVAEVPSRCGGASARGSATSPVGGPTGGSAGTVTGKSDRSAVAALACAAHGSAVSSPTSSRIHSMPTGRTARAALPGRGVLGADAVMRTFNQPNE